jgi:uncharacterized protein (DUF1778 family)
MARPARFGSAATETIRVRVTPDQKRDLERVAKENQTDVSGVIREAVNEYVSDFRESDCFVVQNQHPSVS